jgi:hypothetical protein
MHACRPRSREVVPSSRALAFALVAFLTGCGTGPRPIAYHPITIAAHCAGSEEDGFREDARLVVDDNRVKTIDWTLWVGQRGMCRFDLADFRQTREKPQIELAAKDGSGCKLLVWQEPGHVTLAHADCEARCTPGIYEQAWPVLFDPSSGRCADIR